MKFILCFDTVLWCCFPQQSREPRFFVYVHVVVIIGSLVFRCAFWHGEYRIAAGHNSSRYHSDAPGIFNHASALGVLSAQCVFAVDCSRGEEGLRRPAGCPQRHQLRGSLLEPLLPGGEPGVPCARAAITCIRDNYRTFGVLCAVFSRFHWIFMCSR